MSQDLSIEYPNEVVFITIRTIASRLWFVNNPLLSKAILGFLAKYQEKFGVIIFAFVVMGNHYHLLAKFPNSNRAAFLRAFNSIIARLTKVYVPGFKDGSLWARRARVQVVPNISDIEKQYFYTVLNPVSSGLCERMQEYPEYSSYKDSLSSSPKIYELIDWDDYRNRSRYNRKLRPVDCIKEYTLTFSRLPGYENLNQDEYMSLFTERTEERRKIYVNERYSSDLGFAGRQILRKIKAGAEPKFTKNSNRTSTRPVILTDCLETKRAFLLLYFSIVEAYRKASKRFRAGILDVVFPPGTYRPISAVPF